MKRVFYNQIRKELDRSYQEYQKLSDEYKELKAKRTEGKYSVDYLNKTILPKMVTLSKSMEELQRKLKENIFQYAENMKKELRLADALNPSEITDDIKLLNSGVKLTERDIKTMIERNSNNRTMTQLALRYAQENNIKTGVMYLSNEDKCREYDQIVGSVNTVIKWMDNPKGYQNMYDKIIGDSGILSGHIED
jgi:hypothetical protein